MRASSQRPTEDRMDTTESYDLGPPAPWDDELMTA